MSETGSQQNLPRNHVNHSNEASQPPTEQQQQQQQHCQLGSVGNWNHYHRHHHHQRQNFGSDNNNANLTHQNQLGGHDQHNTTSNNNHNNKTNKSPQQCHHQHALNRDLFLSIGAGHLHAASLFLSYGADLEALDDWQGETPLARACEGGYDRLVEYLLRRGANVHRNNSYRNGVNIFFPMITTATSMFTTTCHTTTTTAGKENRCVSSSLIPTRSSRRKRGNTPLMNAIDGGHLGIVERLLAMPVNNNTTTTAGTEVPLCPNAILWHHYQHHYIRNELGETIWHFLCRSEVRWKQFGTILLSNLTWLSHQRQRLQQRQQQQQQRSRNRAELTTTTTHINDSSHHHHNNNSVMTQVNHSRHHHAHAELAISAAEEEASDVATTSATNRTTTTATTTAATKPSCRCLCVSQVRDHRGWTPLHWACRNGNLVALREMVAALGEDIIRQQFVPPAWEVNSTTTTHLKNHKQSNSNTQKSPPEQQQQQEQQQPIRNCDNLLHLACRKGNLKTVQFILSILRRLRMISPCCYCCFHHRDHHHPQGTKNNLDNKKDISIYFSQILSQRSTHGYTALECACLGDEVSFASEPFSVNDISNDGSSSNASIPLLSMNREQEGQQLLQRHMKQFEIVQSLFSGQCDCNDDDDGAGATMSSNSIETNSISNGNHNNNNNNNKIRVNLHAEAFGGLRALAAAAQRGNANTVRFLLWQGVVSGAITTITCLEAGRNDCVQTNKTSLKQETTTVATAIIGRAKSSTATMTTTRSDHNRREDHLMTTPPPSPINSKKRNCFDVPLENPISIRVAKCTGASEAGQLTPSTTPSTPICGSSCLEPNSIKRARVLFRAFSEV